MLVELRRFPATEVWLESMLDDDLIVGCVVVEPGDAKGFLLHLAARKSRNVQKSVLFFDKGLKLQNPIVVSVKC